MLPLRQNFHIVTGTGEVKTRSIEVIKAYSFFPHFFFISLHNLRISELMYWYIIKMAEKNGTHIFNLHWLDCLQCLRFQKSKGTLFKPAWSPREGHIHSWYIGAKTERRADMRSEPHIHPYTTKVVNRTKCILKYTKYSSSSIWTRDAKLILHGHIQLIMIFSEPNQKKSFLSV